MLISVARLFDCSCGFSTIALASVPIFRRLNWRRDCPTDKETRIQFVSKGLRTVLDALLRSPKLRPFLQMKCENAQVSSPENVLRLQRHDPPRVVVLLGPMATVSVAFFQWSF